jgi:phosphoglucosamine mutase
MGRLFGTDGVRGIAGVDLTEDLAFDLGRAAVLVLGRHGAEHPSFVVGRDPRESGSWLEEALVGGIRSAGGNALLAGVEPTPAIAFLTVDVGAASGVVISASHNPPEYNGIKFFGADGMKLPDELEDEIEALMGAKDAGGSIVGSVELLAAGRERYLDHLVEAVGSKLEGMEVVVDCANGAASEVAPQLLDRLGATVHAIHARPDGKNINEGCGALYPEVVAEEVVRLGADAGVSHDGDADRALFSDANGEVVDGDQVLAACAIDLKERGGLRKDTVVSTVMANLGLHHAMRDAGVEVISAKVGDRYVLEEMLRIDAVLGGEQSGHVIFREHATTGDGLLTAALFLSIAAARGKTIQELASVMRRYPQVVVNVPVADREALEGADDVWLAVRESESALGDDGRILVRASGTEPLVRVMVEAESEALASSYADRVAKAVGASIGA